MQSCATAKCDLERSTQWVFILNKALTHIVTTLLKKYSWKTIAGIQCGPIDEHDRVWNRAIRSCWKPICGMETGLENAHVLNTWQVSLLFG